jgi:hypothetical protein
MKELCLKREGRSEGENDNLFWHPECSAAESKDWLGSQVKGPEGNTK